MVGTTQQRQTLRTLGHMRAAQTLLRRSLLPGTTSGDPGAGIRFASQLAAEAATPSASAAEAGPSSAAALAALRQKLQAGPDLGDFIKGSDLESYSVYAPKPKVSTPLSGRRCSRLPWPCPASLPRPASHRQPPHCCPAGARSQTGVAQERCPRRGQVHGHQSQAARTQAVHCV